MQYTDMKILFTVYEGHCSKLIGAGEAFDADGCLDKDPCNDETFSWAGSPCLE